MSRVPPPIVLCPRCRAALTHRTNADGARVLECTRVCGYQYPLVRAGHGVETERRTNRTRRRKARPGKYDADVARLAAEGLIAREIAERVGTHTEYVYSIALRLGVDLPDGHERNRQCDHDAVAKDYRRGLGISAIAEKHGVSPCTVHLIARKNGLRRYRS